MELRQCGNTDLELSALGAGCWAFGGGEYWGDRSQQDVTEAVHCLVDLGVTYFDTAEAYNDGRSEESLGAALNGIPRDRVCIGTKVSPSNVEPKTLIAHCEASLKRLQTDYVDLYMIHWPIHPYSLSHFTDDEEIIQSPPSEQHAMETLSLLQEQGKIRYAGVSNYGRARLAGALAHGQPLAANQLPYSLLARAIELETLPLCQKAGMGVISYMTLWQGVLTGVYASLDQVPTWQRRTRHFDSRTSDLSRHDGHGAEAETDQALAGIRAVAKEQGLTMSELAIKWVLANPAISCALVGTANARHVEANARAASTPLPFDVTEELNRITQPLMDALGPGMDYYESLENDRT